MNGWTQPIDESEKLMNEIGAIGEILANDPGNLYWHARMNEAIQKDARLHDLAIRLGPGEQTADLAVYTEFCNTLEILAGWAARSLCPACGEQLGAPVCLDCRIDEAKFYEHKNDLEALRHG